MREVPALKQPIPFDAMQYKNRPMGESLHGQAVRQPGQRNRGFEQTGLALALDALAHRAAVEAIVVSMSDEPVMRFCKYWRFEPLA